MGDTIKKKDKKPSKFSVCKFVLKLHFHTFPEKTESKSLDLRITTITHSLN